MAEHTPEWRKWSELPWFARTSEGGTELQLCIRLLEAAVPAEGPVPYLAQQLPDVASEFAVQWAAVLQRTPRWVRIGEFGRQPLEDLPQSFFAEVLDRGAGGIVAIETDRGPGGWSIIAVPVHTQGDAGELLVLCGRALTNRSLPAAMAAGRALGLALEITRARNVTLLRTERLRATLKITSHLNSTRDSEQLLELIAADAARLLEADRSSIFIWDRESHEVVACPALGVEGNKLRLRDDVGIVGECIQTGHTIRVDDAYQDARFNKQVDIDTGYHTRNLLCVPLIDPQGERVGAFEAINKLHGGFTDDDEECLKEFGVHAAVALQNAREREYLVRRQQELTEQVTQGVQIIGQSAAISALRATIERLAATDLPVLVLGESGTGKEVIAQSLHYRGPRRDQPFIAVNCAALTETLLESELFGHEKGAFTDAHDTRQGKFELAHGGTLFLDEIGDMSQGGQAKLLRVLEQKVITRVGGSQSIRTNVRVVAATNANLASAVRDKKFREDLYYRLSVVALELPPLRDRPEDILPLAEYFLDRFAKQAGRRSLLLSVEARRRLQGHAWPGNIRELRNLMERVAFLCPHDRIEAEDLAFILSPDRDAGDSTSQAELSEATAEFQQQHIRKIIKRAKGNMSLAAEMLGLHRSNLYRKMRHLGMTEAGDASD